MDKPNIDKTLQRQRSIKLLKWFVFALMATTLVAFLVAHFVAPVNKFFFTNEGKLICVERREWSFKKGEATCYQIFKVE